MRIHHESPCARPISLGAGASFCSEVLGRAVYLRSERRDDAHIAAKGAHDLRAPNEVGEREVFDCAFGRKLRVDQRLLRKDHGDFGSPAEVSGTRAGFWYDGRPMKHGPPLRSRADERSLEAQPLVLGGRRPAGCTTRPGIYEPLVPNGEPWLRYRPRRGFLRRPSRGVRLR